MSGPGGNVEPVRGANDRRRWRWIFGALVALYLLPLAVGEHLPMMDTPNHLAIVHALVDRSSPSWQEEFEGRLTVRPYGAYYSAMVMLARVLPVEMANRVLLGVVALAVPLAFCYLIGALGGKRRWAALFGVLLIYRDCYYVGFLPYLIGFPCMIVCVGACLRFVARESSGWGLELGIALSLLLTLWSHPLLCVFVPLVLLVLAPQVAVSWKRCLSLAVPCAPAAAAFLVWQISSARTGTRLHWAAPSFNLEYLVRAPLVQVSGVLLGFALAIAVAMVALSWRRWPGVDELKSALSPRQTPVVGLLALVAVYFLSPVGYGTTLWLNLRIADVLWLLLFVAAGPWLTRGWPARALVLLLCLVNVGATIRVHASFSGDLAPLVTVIEEMRPDARVLPIVADARSDVPVPFYAGDRRVPFISLFSYYTHFGSYYHVARGGVSPWMTFSGALDYIPLRLRDPLFRDEFRIAGPFYPKRTLSRLSELSGAFDYILVRTASAEQVESLAAEYEKITQSGPYALFRGRRPAASRSR